MWIDIWLDVRSGYLIAESGEVEMALGFGTVMAVVVGLLLTVLVYPAGRFGQSDVLALAPDHPQTGPPATASLLEPRSRRRDTP